MSPYSTQYTHKGFLGSYLYSCTNCDFLLRVHRCRYHRHGSGGDGSGGGGGGRLSAAIPQLAYPLHIKI